MIRETDFPQAITARDCPRRLNLGCGSRWRAAWINLDLHPHHPSVIRHDVYAPLPFPAQSFDGVYHAHLLEHLPRAHALPFLRECRRVLKPGGVLRVVVPDLEQIARLYLESLTAAWDGDVAARQRYAWAMLEMYDQAVREEPGGAMLAYLADAPAAIAWLRLGADGEVIRQHLERAAPSAPPRSWRALLAGGWRERLLRWLLGREYPLLQGARFRHGGEIHRWMYDRHSLRELLTTAGFGAFRLTTADDSGIPGWADDPLDAAPDGTPAKPDSLYAEAVRP